MSRIGFIVAALAGIIFSAPAIAADYSVARVRHASAPRLANPYCGPCCGCPVVTFVRHRELEMGYPLRFDPRVLDEPRYFYGPVRTYARFGRFADYQDPPY
jgi:hypothetical protein